MKPRTPRATSTDKRIPDTKLFRSLGGDIGGEEAALHREARRLPQRGDERRRLIEPARVDESLGGGLELLRGQLDAAGAVIAVGRRLCGGGGGDDSRHQRRRHGGCSSPHRASPLWFGGYLAPVNAPWIDRQSTRLNSSHS